MMGQYLGVLLVTDISSLVTAHFTTKAASLLIAAGGQGEGVCVLSALCHCEAASEAARG